MKTTFNSSIIPHQFLPLFARSIESPTAEKVKSLYKKLNEESSGKKPDFFSCRSPVDYISGVFSLIGLSSAGYGYSQENTTARNLGVGLTLVGIGTWIYSFVNKFDFTSNHEVHNKPGSQSQNKPLVVIDKSTIPGLIEIIKNNSLDYHLRENAYVALKTGTSPEVENYNILLEELTSFQKAVKTQNLALEEEIKLTKDQISDNLRSGVLDKVLIKQYFSKLLAIANNKKLPHKSRSNAQETYCKLIIKNWKNLDSISNYVKDILISLFKFTEESSSFTKVSRNRFSSEANQLIEDLSKEIKENSDKNGHDLSNYDDFILENFKTWLNSDNYELRESARTFFEYTKHTLGLKPLMESLRTYNPKQTNNRLSLHDYRGKILSVVKNILTDSLTAVGSSETVSDRLKNDLYYYLDDKNPNIVYIACKLVDPRNMKVRNKLLSLLDSSDPLTKLTILDSLNSLRTQEGVKDKIDSISENENEDPFIRYQAIMMSDRPNYESLSQLLVKSLSSEYPEIVERAIVELGTLDRIDQSVIIPLINAGKNGSLQALFLLYNRNIHNQEDPEIKEFLVKHLSKHLDRYDGPHVHHSRIKEIIDELSPPVTPNTAVKEANSPRQNDLAELHREGTLVENPDIA